MIDIKNKVDCCGCNACGDICPTAAIDFHIDNEGFWYPKVSLEKCINCGLCNKTCPNEHPDTHKSSNYEKPISFGAINKNLEIRFDSTSGGIFSALAEAIYKNEGYVGGAIYLEDFSAKQFLSDKKEDLIALRSSKYLQSNAEGFYTSIKNALKTGKEVLICGTPCQISGLYNFLGKDYDNLITIDFICNNVASPLAHRKYFDYLEKKFESKVVYFKAKNKELGWRNLTKKSTFANGKSYYGVKGQDEYSRAYHSHMIARPSCYNCLWKGFPRIADISLGDFWGVENYAKHLDNNTGTSAVMINSDKGDELFNRIKKKIQYVEVKVEDFFKGNQALIKSIPEPNYDRKAFFKDLHTMSFGQLADKWFPIKKQNHSHLRNLRQVVRNIKILTGLNPKPLYQFFKLNFFTKGIKTDWRKGYLFYPTPYCIFDIDKTAQIEVKGTIKLGVKKLTKSKLESRFLFGKNSKVTFEGNFRFGYGCDVEVFDNAELICGAESGGNIGLTLICGNKIEIGSHTFYGRDVSIRDTNGGHIIALQGFKDTNPVKIGDFVWICSESKIMPGVKIGDGTVVGSNSVVISPLPARVLANGDPAKIIETDITWKH